MSSIPQQFTLFTESRVIPQQQSNRSPVSPYPLSKFLIPQVNQDWDTWSDIDLFSDDEEDAMTYSSSGSSSPNNTTARHGGNQLPLQFLDEIDKALDEISSGIMLVASQHTQSQERRAEQVQEKKVSKSPKTQLTVPGSMRRDSYKEGNVIC